MNVLTGRNTALGPAHAGWFSLRFRRSTSRKPAPILEDSRTIASAVRSFSRPAAALIERWLGRAVSKIEEDWRAQAVDAIGELETKVPRLTSEALSRIESFGTIVVEATRIAVRVWENEKRQVLLNAIQNAALPGAPSSAVQLCFLRFVEELSPAHLEALALLNAPREWLRSHGIAEEGFEFCTLNAFVEKCLSVVGGRGGTAESALRGLLMRGLIHQYRADALMSRESLLTSRTTAMGREFAAYVARPQL